MYNRLFTLTRLWGHTPLYPSSFLDEWLPECCHGYMEWDDDSKKRPKRCHGSKEWDDDSSVDL